MLTSVSFVQTLVTCAFSRVSFCCLHIWIFPSAVKKTFDARLIWWKFKHKMTGTSSHLHVALSWCFSIRMNAHVDFRTLNLITEGLPCEKRHFQRRTFYPSLCEGVRTTGLKLLSCVFLLCWHCFGFEHAIERFRESSCCEWKASAVLLLLLIRRSDIHMCYCQ